MGPTLCFSTLGCVERELEDALALARDHGLVAIELRGLGGTLDLSTYFEARFGNPTRLAECIAQYRIAVASLDSSVRIIGAADADRRELLALLPWARAAGAPRIRVFDGGESGSDTELASIGPVLDWWRDTADVAGLKLAIETHDALARPAILQRCRELFPVADILWDSHHTWHEGGEAPEYTWPRLRGSCAHIHVRDGWTDAKGKHLTVAHGEGDFPHADLIAAITYDRFDGIISFEWERYWDSTLAEITGPLRSFLAVYRSLLNATEEPR